MSKPPWDSVEVVVPPPRTHSAQTSGADEAGTSSPNTTPARGPEEAGAIPTAVWSGQIMGIGVYVLDDGRRIIDADDLTMVFERIGSGDLDPDAFGQAIKRFFDGETPGEGA